MSGQLQRAAQAAAVAIHSSAGVDHVFEQRERGPVHAFGRFETDARAALVRTNIDGAVVSFDVVAAELGTRRPMSRRTVYKLVDGSNVRACRLLFGDTYMANRGGVGSYPPHFHGPDGPYGLGRDAKEDIYHSRCASDIPGDVPYVLQNVARPGDPVGVYVHVFDEQAVNVTAGYHDSMAPPAVMYTFTWCLGAFTENERDWNRMMNRPGFEGEW